MWKTLTAFYPFFRWYELLEMQWCISLSLSLSAENNAGIFRKINPMMLFLSVSLYEVFEMVPVLERTLIRHFWLIDVLFCAETICVTFSWEVNLFNLWTWTNSGNFLWLYIWGGSRSAGGTSCPLLLWWMPAVWVQHGGPGLLSGKRMFLHVAATLGRDTLHMTHKNSHLLEVVHWKVLSDTAGAWQGQKWCVETCLCLQLHPCISCADAETVRLNIC